ncbi:MAG: crotonobetainyl-CoA:carnitine CoA-transferase CaiB-like acyl-CoA transferase [Phenylobacterium sp.]
MGPLSNIKVLDLSRILAGPWATQVLADFGATVWKIERPNGGDDTRHWGPPFLKNSAGEDTHESAYYLSANRGKQSLALDISNPQHQHIIHQLIAQADIVVENFKVGGLAKYQLDYPSAKQTNPKIIYCSITGFGQTGPDATAAGYDAMIQARGGLMGVTGDSERSQKAGVAVADLMTAMYSVSSILAALHHRNQTGEGQHIDLALLDTQVAWLANQNMNYLIGGEVPQRHGTAHPNIVPYQSFVTKDGELMLAVGNDRQFKACVIVLGQPELGDDPRFLTNHLRVENRAVLLPLLCQLFIRQTSDHWLNALAEVQVPCGPINNLAEVFADPQVQHRNMLFELEHPLAGQVPMVANPVKFSQTPIEYHKAPPVLGADTEAVLQALGIKGP